MKLLNQALLAKAGWRVMEREEGLSSIKGLSGGLVMEQKFDFELIDGSQTIQKIFSIHARIIGYGEDNIIWRENTGRFSVKSAYDIATNIETVQDCKWKFIWKLKLPPKLRHFLWLVFQGKIITNFQRCVIGLAPEATCPCYHERAEDLNHLFRDCQAAKELGVPIIPYFKRE
ncbi:hypothetical protein ACOSP7_032309 [Xanthoceras sorbifolium]